MKKLVIFDLDGTLINSIEDLGIATNYALEKNGYSSHPITAYPSFVGNGVRKLIERALPADVRTEQTIEKVRLDFKEYYDKHNIDHTVPYKGIPELLKALSDKGISLAIASNKYDAAAKYIISRIFPDVHFAAVEGQKEGIPVKPDPSIVFGILAATEVMKKDVLYVGDSGVDMETARRACVDSVGVDWGFRPVSELQAGLAGHIVSNPLDILDLID